MWTQFSTACLFLLLIVGCQRETPPRANRKLHINIYSEPPTLDPGKAYDVTSGSVLLTLFDGLTRIGLDSAPHLSVAESVDVSEDRLCYTFHLRKSYWSNGDPVTAFDFERSWKRVIDPIFPSQFAQQLFVIRGAREAKRGALPLDKVGVRALDESTLQVDLERPIPYFLSLCASYPYLPVHEGSALSSTDFISNGPFRLQLWRHDEVIVVEKNPLYWDSEAVRLPAIEMAMIDDERTSLLLFERGELDWAGTPICCLPYDALPSLRKQASIHEEPISCVYWYKLETSRFPLNHPKMRRALAYAIDRDLIARSILKGCHAPATRLIPPLQTEKRGSLSLPDGDQALARKLLEEVLEEWGMTRSDLPPIVISYNQAEEHHRVAQVIQSQWEEALGIQVTLAASEWRVHLSNLSNHNYQVARQSWIATVEDPIDFLQLFQFRNSAALGGNNDTSWENEKFSSLVDAAMNERNEERRGDLLAQGEALFLEEMPAIPLFFCSVSYLLHPELQNVCLSRLGRLDFKWAYFEEAQ